MTQGNQALFLPIEGTRKATAPKNNVQVENFTERGKEQITPWVMLPSVPKPHYASKQSGAQLHPPHGRGAAAQPWWSDRAQEAAAETAASSVRGHQQQKTTRQR